MKKTIIKLFVFLIIFIVSLMAAGRIMNKEHDNLTMEMAPATYPIVTMGRNGVEYNELHGYKEARNTASAPRSTSIFARVTALFPGQPPQLTKPTTSHGP